MTKLYALDLHPYQSGRWRELAPSLPDDRKRRIRDCRFDADKAGIAGAGWLLQYALQQEGIAPEQQIFTKNEFGKPLLQTMPEVHFSLSHGGTLAICAVSDHPIGVDVELPRCNMKIAQRYFSPEELEWVSGLTPFRQIDALNRLWTGKEAFTKALGVGLTIPLDSFRILLTEKTATLYQTQSELPYRLHEYQPNLSRICLCTIDGKPDLQIVQP